MSKAIQRRINRNIEMFSDGWPQKIKETIAEIEEEEESNTGNSGSYRWQARWKLERLIVAGIEAHICLQKSGWAQGYAKNTQQLNSLLDAVEEAMSPTVEILKDLDEEGKSSEEIHRRVNERIYGVSET